jgi:hypothetical protein
MSGRTAGESLREALRLRRLAEALLFLAVAAEREQGTTWEEIGAAMGIAKASVHNRFASWVKEHSDGDPDRSASQALEDGWEPVAELVGLRARKATLEAEIREITHRMEGDAGTSRGEAV